jgi:hypothetical protein
MELAVALPFIIHEVIKNPETLVDFFLSDPESKAYKEQILVFLDAWICVGKPMEVELLEKMLVLVRQFEESHVRSRCSKNISCALTYSSPVLGRWRVGLSPRSDVLGWIDYPIEEIVGALTNMCLPFYRLRSFEFEEGQLGKHLKELNLRYKSVSTFVTESVLAASVLSKRRGIATVERWLEVAAGLHQSLNYHMLFAVQNGLQKHQVDRLDVGISKKHAKIKAKIDLLFDATTGMAMMKKEINENVEKLRPMIPCVFWLLQKALLLKESPLYVDNQLNLDRINAARNVFKDMATMQSCPYPKRQVDEKVLWFFMRIERKLSDFLDDDSLYVLSDAAKVHLATSSSTRKRSGSFIGQMTSRSRKNSIDPLIAGSSPRENIPESDAVSMGYIFKLSKSMTSKGEEAGGGDELMKMK